MMPASKKTFSRFQGTESAVPVKHYMPDAGMSKGLNLKVRHFYFARRG